MALLDCHQTVPHLLDTNIPVSNPADKADKHVAFTNAETYICGDDTSTSIYKSMEPENSRLLSLPKELRLEIWRHVLTDTTKERSVVRIKRCLHKSSTSGKRFSNSLHKHSLKPEIEATFVESLSFTRGVNLLRTNHFIYNEALPILYHSVSFFICDLGGIFQLFLDQLSAFAKGHIRYVRLEMHERWRYTHSFFYWSMTCAQIAKLSDSLRLVEVEGWKAVDIKNSPRERRILYALLKIKAPKKLVGGIGNDADFQNVLRMSAVTLESKTIVRKAVTAADTMRTKSRAEAEQQKIEHLLRKRQKVDELTFRERAMTGFLKLCNHGEVERDLVAIRGIKQFEEELSHWEMVGNASASSSPRLGTTSTSEEASWVDTASTIVAKNEDDTEGDKDVDSWEIVDK